MQEPERSKVLFSRILFIERIGLLMGKATVTLRMVCEVTANIKVDDDSVFDEDTAISEAEKIFDKKFEEICAIEDFEVDRTSVDDADVDDEEGFEEEEEDESDEEDEDESEEKEDDEDDTATTTK